MDNEYFKIAQQLPNSDDNLSAFVVKYGKRRAHEIGNRLLCNSVATYEHIKPQADGIVNGLYNYLAECAGCNSSRKETPLNEWITAHPKMLKHIRIYMREFIAYSETSARKDFKTYPTDVIKSLKEQTVDKELKKPQPNQKMVRKFEGLIYDLKLMAKEFNKKQEAKKLLEIDA